MYIDDPGNGIGGRRAERHELVSEIRHRTFNKITEIQGFTNLSIFRSTNKKVWQASKTVKPKTKKRGKENVASIDDGLFTTLKNQSNHFFRPAQSIFVPSFYFCTCNRKQNAGDLRKKTGIANGSHKIPGVTATSDFVQKKNKDKMAKIFPAEAN